MSKSPQSQLFRWHGETALGTYRKGEIFAENSQQARTTLLQAGIQNLRLSRHSRKPLLFRKTIPSSEIALLTRQLATMLKAGIPLLQTIDIVIDGLKAARMISITTALRSEIAAGSSLSESLRHHPLAFDDLYCSLVDLGEMSGTLDTVLERLALFREKSEILKGKVHKAMVYPSAVILVAIVTTTILLVKVVPALAATFNDFGAELPAFTRIVIGLSDWASTHWWKILLLGSLVTASFQISWNTSMNFRHLVDRLSLRLPPLSRVIHTSCQARFCRTLATTYAAGVPLALALDSVASAAGNSVYENAVRELRRRVSSGQPFHSAISESTLFPLMLCQLMKIGEATGTLESMLERSANHFELEVDDLVDNLTSLLEPAIIVIVGSVVGSLIIAMYLPIIQLGSII